MNFIFWNRDVDWPRLLVGGIVIGAAVWVCRGPSRARPRYNDGMLIHGETRVGRGRIPDGRGSTYLHSVLYVFDVQAWGTHEIRVVVQHKSSVADVTATYAGFDR